jgi:RNA-directed DNA polymerase
VKQEYNPYDPQWWPYFEERQRSRTSEAMKGKWQYQIWKNQGEICPVCKQPITDDTDYDIHHIFEQSKGGTDDSSNLVMLHINCHRQVHNAKEKVL